MKFNKKLLVVILIVIFNITLIAKEEISINFKDLDIEDLVKITSKVIEKNILITTNVKGKVEFISNKPIYKEDLLNLTVFVLESKGYTIVENEGILRIIRLSDAAKYNAPVYSNSKKFQEFMMLTEVFNVENYNADYVSSKIRHLISKSAKLVTDKESNTIILTDFPANIKTIKKVISLIAQDAQKTIEIIDLKNIQASTVLGDLKNVAKAVFNEKIEKEKVSILLNKDTNSIMFVGKKGNVKFLVKYLEDIDHKGSLVEKVVDVVYLKNAESKNVIKTLNGIIAQKVYKDKNNKPFASTDDEANSIILMGPKDEIFYFKQLIEKLDIDKQQVYVKARIIEVSESKTKELGVRYGLSGFNAGTSGLLAFNSGLNRAGTDVPLLDILDAGSYGFDVANMNYGLALGATINLLNNNGALDIISEPSLLCINNKESSIYVGETRSIKTGTTTTTGGNTNDTYKREDIGLTLKVKPRISNSNKVLLDITTKLEDVEETTITTQPPTSKKELVTSAIVTNGESVILGGYIKEKNENTVHSLPLLGDIPVLGNLFKNDYDLKDKINLIIIITPYIIPKSKDLTYIRNQLSQLKLLEEKFTKDALLKLEKRKLQHSLENQVRKEELEEVLEEQKELKEETIESQIEKKSNKQLGQEYINKSFGL